MNLILTMAGKYSRFTEAGYKLPKYLLPWGNRSILSEILLRLSLSYFKNIYLIANQEDECYACHIRDIMNYYNIPGGNLFFISDTRGQAATAFEALLNINKAGNVVFHNIDTILYNRNFSLIKKALTENDGYLDVFSSNNHEYSYVLAKDGLAEVIMEKVLISNLATSGLYGFSSAALFNRYYNGEIYISDIYKNMIADKKKIAIGPMYEEKDTVVLGTPKEYISRSNLIF